MVTHSRMCVPAVLLATALGAQIPGDYGWGELHPDGLQHQAPAVSRTINDNGGLNGLYKYFSNIANQIKKPQMKPKKHVKFDDSQELPQVFHRGKLHPQKIKEEQSTPTWPSTSTQPSTPTWPSSPSRQRFLQQPTTWKWTERVTRRAVTRRGEVETSAPLVLRERTRDAEGRLKDVCQSDHRIPAGVGKGEYSLVTNQQGERFFCWFSQTAPWYELVTRRNGEQVYVLLEQVVDTQGPRNKCHISQHARPGLDAGAYELVTDKLGAEYYCWFTLEATQAIAPEEPTYSEDA